jgi:zinc protease
MTGAHPLPPPAFPSRRGAPGGVFPPPNSPGDDHGALPPKNPRLFRVLGRQRYLGGSGFGSRLTSEIRSDRGLAYSVGSFYRGSVGYGVFGAYCMTKSASALEAARLMRGIIERVRDEGVSAPELRRAKDAIVNNLIFSVDGSREVVAQRMGFAYDGLPEDFLQRFRDRIEAVTLEDVRSAAGRHLRPDALSTIVVGDEPSLAGLEELGPVTRINLRSY